MRNFWKRDETVSRMKTETHGPSHTPRVTWRLGGDGSTRYVACWSEDNAPVFCGHQHKTLPEAAACIQGVDGSLKAFTEGRERPLTTKEHEALVTALLALCHDQRELLSQDDLTGALNRLGFKEALKYESSVPLTFVSLDLDGFKPLNDTLGYATGDKVLKVMSWTMQNTLREKDSVARLHRDEFSLLLPDTGAEHARVIVAKLHEALKAAMKTYQWDITFSIVAVTFETPATPDHMIETVERQMGLAKQMGENRVSYHVHA